MGGEETTRVALPVVHDDRLRVSSPVHGNAGEVCQIRVGLSAAGAINVILDGWMAPGAAGDTWIQIQKASLASSEVAVAGWVPIKQWLRDNSNLDENPLQPGLEPVVFDDLAAGCYMIVAVATLGARMKWSTDVIEVKDGEVTSVALKRAAGPYGVTVVKGGPPPSENVIFVVTWDKPEWCPAGAPQPRCAVAVPVTDWGANQALHIEGLPRSFQVGYSGGELQTVNLGAVKQCLLR
jgi:hypothetical protein